MYNEKGTQYLLNNRNIAIDRVRANRMNNKKNKTNSNTNKSTKSTPKSLVNDKRNEELLKEIEDLRMENDYLKKLQALVQKRTNKKGKSISRL